MGSGLCLLLVGPLFVLNCIFVRLKERIVRKRGGWRTKLDPTFYTFIVLSP
ncbi:hypothetical protein J2T15_001838 [Paenibacillus harenae]|uniref:DUF418 domain-containing protein n=1 Tax=Paenibacillus harenae TaxID=306543 RepID=A0ABT9U099_PAEHA|nr:hypothetical protein [Paenibacillus harenae]